MSVNNIEKHIYVASDEDVANLTETILNSADDLDNGKRTYLKTLIATVQHELGSKPRLLRSAHKKLGDDAIAVQLRALAQVHDRFYKVVVRVAGATVPLNFKDRAIEINRRTNFARTAAYVVRMWIRAGNDIITVGVQTATKASLEVPRNTAVSSEKFLVRQAERQSKTLMASLMALADLDKPAAIEEMQLILGQLTTQLLAMGVTATKDAALSMHESRPLRIGKTLFMPTQTQILRQQEKPS